MSTFSRRRFLSRSLAAATASGLILPRLSAASAGDNERKFLFVLASGGWDTSYLFTPAFDNSSVDTEPDATTATIDGLTFVDSEKRPAVRTFFESYAHRACILNGIEVRSVTHERCEQLLLTGTVGSADDWPSIIAAQSAYARLMPHLVVYGSAYTNRYTNGVVRIGSNGQLPDLLDGTALMRSGIATPRVSGDVDAAVDAYVRQRAAAVAAAAGDPGRLGAGYGTALDDLAGLEQIASSLTLDPVDAGCERDLASDGASVLECFATGLSRCGMIQFDGWCGERWDTHSGNDKQGIHYQQLFSYLERLMADLDSRVGSTGAPLSEEVTIVVLSEMGRHPQLNFSGGKDHWTYTSAMLLGAGVTGGQVIGAMDDNFQGSSVDLASGAVSSSGTDLLPNTLGATLLAMADIDPGDHLTDGSQPITAVMG
ncbi:MAG: hypothetical protein ACI8RZ_001893 [Myxococcota bacterium]|jgi:uncharacterized protein (DUF1501 family)